MKAVRAAVIGDPIGHSKSPVIFEQLGKLLGTRIIYRKQRVRPKELERALRRLRRLAYRGCSVTIPHKQSVIPFLRRLTSQARAIGAVNVIRFDKNGPVGHNTDAAGFADALKETGVKVKGADAVVYGAGGAARAVGYALGRMKARKVTFAARNKEKAKLAAKDIGKSFPKTRYAAATMGTKAKLQINATPLGLNGFAQRSAAASLPLCELAFDVVYGRQTPFLRQAIRRGAKAVDGTGMLVYQALRAWQYWGGSLAGRSRTALKNDIIRGL